MKNMMIANDDEGVSIAEEGREEGMDDDTMQKEQKRKKPQIF